MFVTGTAAALVCHAGTHAGTQFFEAEHPFLQAVSVLLLLRVNKQKIMPFLSGSTGS